MSITSKRLASSDRLTGKDIILELDPQKLIVREIKILHTNVIRELNFDEFEFCFHNPNKKTWYVQIVEDRDKSFYNLKNERDKKILHEYFKKHSVKWYDSNKLKSVILDTPEKSPEEMTESELREEMFSPLGKVPIENSDGTVEYIASYNKIADDVHCLITENGRTYHTHVGCFSNWKPGQQKNFKGWKYTTIEKAESMGMRKCSFCDEADNRPEETIDDFLEWLDEEETQDDEL